MSAPKHDEDNKLLDFIAKLSEILEEKKYKFKMLKDCAVFKILKNKKGFYINDYHESETNSKDLAEVSVNSERVVIKFNSKETLQDFLEKINKILSKIPGLQGVLFKVENHNVLSYFNEFSMPFQKFFAPVDSLLKKTPKDFLKQAIDEDKKKNPNLLFRFPPEPNGYLHIGHVMAIVVNFSLAEEYNTGCILRFDDTNPEKEKQEYIDAIKRDIKWLGYTPKEIRFTSDYFDILYDWACKMIERELFYVDFQSQEEIRAQRGTLTIPGSKSKYRDRSISENLKDFKKMVSGEYKEGECVLRAKIDMQSSNLNMRDPVVYRVKSKPHPKTGNKYFAYPSYDWAHGQSDAIEHISHSICTLEFENHRPLYNWFLNELKPELKEIGVDVPPRQMEFARLNVSNMITSKRKLLSLVEKGLVSSWDDPRMPTISGLKRRGYSPESLRSFIKSLDVNKNNAIIDILEMEFHLKRDLENRALRRMVVFNPILLIIENYDSEGEYLDLKDGIKNRRVFFEKRIYVEKTDFETESKIASGREFRLYGAYYVTIKNVERDEDGVVKIICNYDHQSKGGWREDKKNVSGTLHWVSESKNTTVALNLYSRLFLQKTPVFELEDIEKAVNPNSLQKIKAVAEESLKEASPDDYYQFLRKGYFKLDREKQDNLLAFNLTVEL